MSAAASFAKDYAEARARFRDAATEAGGELASYQNPGRGPGGEALATDIGWFGPREAERVLVVMSGTHGVEGFCGSGIQVASLEGGFARELRAGTALLMIHAVNPHGFSWLRRVTEENVDLNRNFIDHAKGLPTNPGYDELAEAICPREWNDAALAVAQAQLDAYGAAHGTKALSKAVSGGQYTHRDGVFYGGAERTWAGRTLETIVREHLGRARRVGVIDYHTGLGPYGYGEPIVVHEPESASLKRSFEWYGEKVTSPALGSSTSAELHGVNVFGIERALAAGVELTGMALEYGTLPLWEVRDAVRADNWLHHHGDLASAKGRELKRRIRDAFYCDKDDWKEMLVEQAMTRQRQALAGLAA